eukprot:scaffold3526_cov153-Amphora_coffeaeformis.AAC.1
MTWLFLIDDFSFMGGLQTMSTASYEYLGALADSDPLSILVSIFLFPFLLQAIWYLVGFSASCVYALFVPRKGDENKDEEESIESMDMVPAHDETRNESEKDSPKKLSTPLYPNDPRSPPPSKSILDLPIRVKRDRSPTKARTPQQEERAITNLMKQVGCSRVEATEVLRRTIAKERALGCY